jgi:hypothetical protein
MSKIILNIIPYLFDYAKVQTLLRTNCEMTRVSGIIS